MAALKRSRPHSQGPSNPSKKIKAGGKDRGNLNNGEEESPVVVQHGRHSQASNSEDGVSQNTARKRLDPQTKSYFLEISALVNDGGEGDLEERETICRQALEESCGQELQLACDPSCGRVLESLLLACDVPLILEFLMRCCPVAVDMAVDPSGSHILETALKSVARTLQDDTVQSQDWFATLELTLARISQELGSKSVDVMFNRYGSHVLRCLFALLSGDCSEILSNSASSTKGSRNLADKLGAFTSKPRYGQFVRSKGLAFPDVLKSLVDKIFESSTGKMQEMRTDNCAGPVLQALLKALQGKSVAVVQAIATILDSSPDGLWKEGSVLEKCSVEDVIATLEDRSSSHIMEVIIQSAPNALYLEIFQRFFRKRLLQLSLHPSANFTVQVLIACVRHEGQVNMIFEELEKNFTDLVFNKRSGVVAALLAACGRFQTRQKEACRAVAGALNSNKPSPTLLVPRLLHLESASENGTFLEDLDVFSNSRMSVVGSVILQTILKFPKECSQPFCASIAAMESGNLLQTVRDPSGSHALEAFLESPAAPTKHKHRTISKLEGHFADLALHPIGCFVVEKCFVASDIRLKEKIASELAPIYSDLSKTGNGSRISRRCDIAGYTKKPEQWRMKESTKQSTHKAFSELFKPDVEKAVEVQEPGGAVSEAADEKVHEEVSVKKVSDAGTIHAQNAKKKKKSGRSKNVAVGKENLRKIEDMLLGL